MSTWGTIQIRVVVVKPKQDKNDLSLSADGVADDGDEIVRQKLDELIDAHHSAARFAKPGNAEPGTRVEASSSAFGKDRDQAVIVRERPEVGYEGTPPVLLAVPDLVKIRLRPDVERHLVLGVVPTSAWPGLQQMQVRV